MSKWKIGDWVYTYDKYGLYFKNQVRNIFEYKNKDGSIYFKYQLTGDPNKEWGENEMFRLKRECLQGMKDAGIEEHSLAFATLLKTEDECRELYLKNKALEEENEHLKNGIKMCKSVEDFDFVKENLKLTKQIAEKDKQIEELKAKQWHSKIDLRDEILNKIYREFNWLFKNDKNYVNLMNIVDNAIDNYESNQRHQICEKIREKTQKHLNVDLLNMNDCYHRMLPAFILAEILDQIEKGEL